tara:strand:+ start:1791 stop:2255 length:465 start_codon:yes stop_codon:yes gene_type:complete
MEVSGKNNINPEIWGSTFWNTLHFTAFGYPDIPNEMDKDVYKNFIINFVKILPCDKCSSDARTYINNMYDVEWAESLKDRDSLLKWTWAFHDDINRKLNKKSISLEYFLNNFLKTKTKPEPKKVTMKETLNRILIFIMLITFALFYARYLRTTR